MNNCPHHRRMFWDGHTACLSCGQMILPDVEPPKVKVKRKPKLSGNGRLVLSRIKEGKAYEEISKETGFSISTVKAIETMALRAIGKDKNG